MGECKYCGKPAGFMRRQHSECHKRRDEATSRILGAFSKWMKSNSPPTGLHKATAKFANANFVGDDELYLLTRRGFTAAIDTALEDPAANY